MPRIYRKIPLKDRFWPKVKKGQRCWLWIGPRNWQGYGTLGNGQRGKNISAHRASWMIKHKKEIPKGMCICHKCDNPSCVRPGHLFLGSYSENGQDASRKGRFNPPGYKGEDHPQAKLTEYKVRRIRALYIKGKRGFGIRSLAQEFGVFHTNILRIVKRETWKHIA